MKPFRPRYRFRIQFMGPLRGYTVEHGHNRSTMQPMPAMVRIETLESAMAYCVTIANERQTMRYSIKVEPPAVTLR